MSEADEVRAIALVHSNANRIYTEKLKTTIAVLEKLNDGLRFEFDYADARIRKLETTLTAERQRREECEAVLREVARAPNRIAENSRIIADYFSRYEL